MLESSILSALLPRQSGKQQRKQEKKQTALPVVLPDYSAPALSLLVLLLLGCDPPRLPAPEAPPDPFRSVSTFALDHPGRAMAVSRVAGTTAVFVAREFENDVLAVELRADGWRQIGSMAAAAGPRAICANGDTVLVASTSSATLSRFTFDGIALTFSWSVTLDAPPNALDCADLNGDGASEGLVATGFADESRIVSVDSDGDVKPDAIATTGASFVRAGDLDGDGDTDGIALSTTQSSLWLLTNAGGRLTLGPLIKLDCASPRAAEVLRTENGRRAVAVACDGAVLIVRDPLLSNPSVETFPAPKRLYGLAAFAAEPSRVAVDSPDSLAIIGIHSHELSVKMRPSDSAWSNHPVAMGPVALVDFDVDADGDTDLIVLSLEQARLSLFANQPVQDGADSGSIRSGG